MAALIVSISRVTSEQSAEQSIQAFVEHSRFELDETRQGGEVWCGVAGLR